MHRHFSFAIATLQLFQYPENVKISFFPITLSQEKCYIFKSIWRIFKNLFCLKDEGRGSCGWKFEVHRHFSFRNSNVTIFPISRKCKNLNFSHYTVPAEMLYLQKYLANFKKFFWLKDEERGSCGWKFEVHRYFSFCESNVKTFPISRKCKNFNFSRYTVPAEMLYLQKYLNHLQKLFWLKDEERGYSGWKFKMHRHFSFAIATLQLFQYPEKVKVSIFPITLSQEKCHIFKSI